MEPIPTPQPCPIVSKPGPSKTPKDLLCTALWKPTTVCMRPLHPYIPAVAPPLQDNPAAQRVMQAAVHTGLFGGGGGGDATFCSHWKSLV